MKIVNNKGTNISQLFTSGLTMATLLVLFTASGCIVANRPYYRTLPTPGSRQVVVRQFGGPYMYSGYYNPWWAINGNFYGSPYVVNGPIAYRRFRGRRGIRGGRMGGRRGPIMRSAPRRIRPR